MPQARPDRRILDVAPEKEVDKKLEPNFEVQTIFYSLKQNFPDVYRHILGIAKAFLKDR
jgi:hypothetical protein